MQIGYIGLGKMGINMVLRLLGQGINVVAWNRSPEPKNIAAANGAIVTDTVAELVRMLEKPSVIWLMLPAGRVVDEMITQLSDLLSENDIVIDGGNSFYEDSWRRAAILAGKSVKFLDVGVSGGPQGAQNGACLMIGGEKKNFDQLKELWQAIAAPDAYAHVGPIGAGHFAKMVHNGIEYGMMEAIAEGSAVMKQSKFDYDLGQVFTIYNRQSVISSRLIGWAGEAFTEDATLFRVSSVISASGEGEWTVKEAEKLGVNVPVIAKSLQVRIDSVNDKESSADGFRNKVVSALRWKFGGHKVTK